MEISFNGKFFGHSMTGVQRVAFELICALDRGISEGAYGGESKIEVLCPRNTGSVPKFSSITLRRGGSFTWQFWEQFDLPRLARGRLLINLCNLAPLNAHGHITMIHDAQVYLTPQSYSRSFAEWYRFALPKISKRASKILTVSNYSREMLQNYGVVEEEKVTVIYNGVDHMRNLAPDATIIRSLNLTGKPFVVAAANTQSHKNVKVLIDAFRTPELASLSLVLIGKASADDFARQGCLCPPNIVFAGQVSDQGYRALLETAICYACPSLTEGFGLPPLEAMFVSCPAVVSPCGALPEVCEDGALYASPTESDSWAAAILDLAEDTSLRDRMASTGKIQASKFEWQRAARQLMAATKDLD